VRMPVISVRVGRPVEDLGTIRLTQFTGNWHCGGWRRRRWNATNHHRFGFWLRSPGQNPKKENTQIHILITSEKKSAVAGCGCLGKWVIFSQSQWLPTDRKSGSFEVICFCPKNCRRPILTCFLLCFPFFLLSFPHQSLRFRRKFVSSFSFPWLIFCESDRRFWQVFSLLNLSMMYLLFSPHHLFSWFLVSHFPKVIQRLWIVKLGFCFLWIFVNEIKFSI